MNLTVRVEQEAMQQMRAFLRDNRISVPFRNDDVIAKYLRHVIDSNNSWDGIDAQVALTRPYPGRYPWQLGYEHERHPLLAEPSRKLVHRLKGLALGSFGLLMMLACYVAFCQ